MCERERPPHRGSDVPSHSAHRGGRQVSKRVADGPMTIMFPDVEASTALHARRGDAEARAILVACQNLMREQVKAAGGRAVKSTGDGLMVTFSSPRKALSGA